LITAVHETRHDILKMFVENGVFQNDKDGSLGAEALRRAVLDDNKEALGILLAAGADPVKAGWHGRCPIMEAVSFGKIDLAISLSELVVDLKEPKDKDGEGLLYYAVARGSRRYAKYLLDRGFGPEDTHEPELPAALEALCCDDSSSI
jgi:ankyrin repeat protein